MIELIKESKLYVEMQIVKMHDIMMYHHNMRMDTT